MKILVLIIMSVIAACAGQLLMRCGTLQSGDMLAKYGLSIPGWKMLLSNGSILAGLGLWTISTLLYLVVLCRTDLSFAYCLGSLNYAIVPLASRWIFHESIPPLRVVSIAVIFTGVFLAFISKILEGGIAKL